MKPVAYAMFRNGEYYDAIHPEEQAKTVGEYDIPLYTHPAKTLTDKEILNVWISSNFVRFTEDGQINEIFFSKFARAILRKAQEK
jgi:hypothetical protein